MTEASNHRRSVERGLQRALVALVALFAVDWCGTVIGTPVLHRPVVVLASAVQLLDWVVLCVQGWRTRLKPVDALRTCGVTTVALVALSFADATAVAPATRIQFIVILAVLAAVVFPVLMVVAVVMPPVAAYLTGAVPVGGWLVLGELWPVLSAVGAASAAFPALRTAASAAEEAQQRLDDVRAREVSAASKWTAHAELQRLLHDHVTSALHAVAAAWGTGAEIRQAAARAAEALRVDSPPPGTDLVDVGSVVRQASGVGRTPVEFDLADSVSAPAEVAQAMALAVAEALRNVDRHAQASRVVVTLTLLPRGFAVSVIDNGVGPVRRTRPGALGVWRSIRQRVADVGGTALITGAAGVGMTVTLQWVPTSAESPDLLGLAVGDIRTPLVGVVVSYLLGNGIAAALHVRDVRLVVWGLLLVLVTVLLLSRANRAWKGRHGVMVLAGLFAFACVGMAMMPAGSLNGYESWPVGSVGMALMVLAVMVPVWQVFLFCLLEAIAVLALIGLSVLDPQPLPTLVPVFLAPVFGTAMGAVVAVTARRYGHVVARSRTERFAVQTMQARRAAAEALRTERIEALAVDFVPFLDGIADGTVPYDDPATIARAGHLEQASRDELHLPGVLDAPTKAAIAAARASGCVVDFYTDTDTIVVPRQVTTLLRNALTVLPTQLNLSLYRQSTGVLVSLVAVPGDSARATYLRNALPGPGLSVDDDAEATIVEFTP
nr:ATP-binding protein [Kibdelosporangium sp. MJ126-NF4]CEL13487.1 Two-component system, sensor protein [Kibdelosporangium sp. MJ126-NF4]CTQ99173.1 Two-component system, sensor protein [Kibdelosporangium sp. MJ126-NF4]